MNHMDHLRNAGPAAPGATIDRDALFAGIVARPGDAAYMARRGRVRPKRKLAIALAGAALIALTAGTALAVTGLLGWHTETHLIKSPAKWRALYHAATRQLTLPPGDTWPYRTLAPNTVTPVNGPGGMAVAISQTSWECYWVGAIRRHDTAAQQQAQAALADIVAHHILVAPPRSSENVAPPAGSKPPFEIFASDGGIQYVTKMYADAAAGRPATLIQSCLANGPHSH